MPSDSARTPGDAAPTTGAPASSSTTTGLGRELGGDLPCVVCGYNLRGLSIRSLCPECGTSLRATILSLVDPLASELRPIEAPRLVSAGVLMWAFGAVVVAVVSWVPQVADALRLGGVVVNRPSAALGTLGGLAMSGVGSLALVRPHGGISRVHGAMAMLAALAYLPLGWLLWRYHAAVDLQAGQHYLAGWSSTAAMSYTLAGAGAVIATIILLQRPNARLLVARSMVMRTGRVDRQTMLAMSAAAVVLGVGALMGRLDVSRATTLRELARTGGVVLIAFGGVMLTIGSLGCLLDCARIAGAILIPKTTVRQVIREGSPRSRSRFMKVIDPNRPGAGIGDAGPPPAASGPRT